MIIINKVVLLGRLTKDPVLNYAAGSGTAVCSFTLAVARPFKKDETDFINCKAFGKIGENISKYMTKGRQLAVTGAIRTGSYDGNDGIKRYTTEIIIESSEFIGNNNANSSNSNGFGNSSNNGFGSSFEEDMMPVEDGDMPFR